MHIQSSIGIKTHIWNTKT